MRAILSLTSVLSVVAVEPRDRRPSDFRQLYALAHDCFAVAHLRSVAQEWAG